MKVSIYQEPCFGSISITFWEQRDGKHYMAQYDLPKWVEVKESEPTNPSIRLPFDSLKNLAEALESHGVKTDSDAKIIGTLEATRKHLEDMQKIVFKEFK